MGDLNKLCVYEFGEYDLFLSVNVSVCEYGIFL